MDVSRISAYQLESIEEMDSLKNVPNGISPNLDSETNSSDTLVSGDEMVLNSPAAVAGFAEMRTLYDSPLYGSIPTILILAND